jgi:alkylation response protein AidB-like acyl-CoA dehydrogenase
MVDEPSFAEVFFEEVLVPKRNLIGEKNRGWEYLIVALDFERTFAITQMGVVRRLLDHLLEYGRREGREMLLRNPNLRSRLASLATECQVGRLICYQQAYAEEKGQISSYGASMAKNFSAELFQRAANVGMQLLGNYGQLTRSSRWVRLGGWVEYAYLGSTSWPIWGGTSEINRNVIAQRGLGLPRR